MPERRARAPVARSWHLYVVRCGDGTLYSGVTTDVARRLDEHRAAGRRGARYLRGRAPLEVVYQRRIGERGLALRLESRFKRRSRAEKQDLVARRPSRRSLLRLLGVANAPNVGGGFETTTSDGEPRRSQGR